MIPQARPASIAVPPHGAPTLPRWRSPPGGAGEERAGPRSGEESTAPGPACEGHGPGRHRGRTRGLGAAQGYRSGMRPCRGRGVTSITGMRLDTLSFVYHIL